MVCFSVYLVYVESQEFYNISLLSVVHTCHLNASYNRPKIFLIWSFHNIIVTVQYIYGFSLVEHALINLAFLKTVY